MKINEVEKILDIPKATIRFYEKEGLLTPQRNENSYRDYSDSDVERLKKIVVLRKIGVAVEDIKQVLDGALSLQDALTKNMAALYQQMEEIKGAIKVCALMQEKEESISSFDENYYWTVISAEEQQGNKFFEIARDYLLFEKELLDNVTGGGNKTLAAIAGCLFLGAIVRGLVSCWAGDGFWPGFLGAFAVLLAVSLIFLPAFLLRHKEKARETYMKWVVYIAGAFLIFVLGALVVLLLNTQFHFLF